ncbi:MAG: cbb3-type cytochrome c oxidase subunit 3 [Proteobacteria bacterium]|nr:cbb3-type cytochrome c oxidase subunit 3 [Pseudomonadota bacterium]
MTELKEIGEFLATLWTVWAVLIFLGIAFWALRPKNRKRFEHDANIPLNDER